jgi:hypothetical protein
MEMSEPTIERLIQIPANQDICRLILQHKLSAHPDDVEELSLVCSNVPSHQQYCPDPLNYAYVIRYTNSDVIFAAVFGMNALILRLPQNMIREAVGQGGHQFPLLPQEWVVFSTFRQDEYLDITRKQVKHWCEVAYLYAERL